MVNAGARSDVPFSVKWQAVMAVEAGHGEIAVMEAFGLRAEKSIARWREAVANYGPTEIGGTAAEAEAAALLPVPSIRPRANTQHSDDARRVFAEVVNAGHGYETASKRAGIPMSTGWAWYHRLRRGHSLTLGDVPSTKSYSAQVKLAAAQAVIDEGMTRAEALAHFGITSHSSLGVWTRAYQRLGVKAFEAARPTPPVAASAGDDLLSELDPGLSVEMKMQLVASLSGKHPVRALLRAVKLAPSTYYYRRSRPPRKDRYEEVLPLLRGLFEKAYRAYGYRRLRVQLQREHGLSVSGKTVRRLIREEGCTCLVRREKRRTTRPESPENVFAPNILKRDWTTTATGQKWVTDVTQFTVGGQLLFLSPLMDLHSRKIISYQLDTNQNMPMILDMLAAPLPHAVAGTTVLHSDRGWQYQHHTFRQRLRRQGIIQSMSRSGNCYDNSIAENFFSHFKQEFLRGRSFTLQSFPAELNQWIRWFNQDRISFVGNLAD